MIKETVCECRLRTEKRESQHTWWVRPVSWRGTGSAYDVVNDYPSLVPSARPSGPAVIKATDLLVD